METQIDSTDSIREQLRKRGIFPANIVRFAYRPIRQSLALLGAGDEILNEKRPNISLTLFNGIWIAATQQNRKKSDPPIVRRHLLPFT